MNLAIWNAIIPGSGLILRDRILLGCAVLLATLCVLSVVLLADLLAVADFSMQLRRLGLLSYLALALIASLLWYLCESATPLAVETLRQAHARISRAWLRGDAQQAQEQAWRLVRQGHRLPETWDLLALVSEGRQRQRAQARAQALRRRSAE